MSLKYPDELKHNNPDYATVDADFVRGGGRVVANLTELYALTAKLDQLKQRITKVYVTAEAKTYTLKDITNVGNTNGWEVEANGVGASVEYSTDIEADKLSTTKVAAIVTFYNWAVAKFAAAIHTHAYSSLSGLPTLFNGAWADLTGKPTFFSGSYTDLTNKPTIPAAQQNSDWNASSGVTQILNKPTIPTQYADSDVRASTLTGVSQAGTLANVAVTDTQLTAWGKFMKLYSSLKALAFKDTIDYTSSDITNKPTIPTALSGLSEDATHRTVTDTEKSTWNGKQATLVSGTNIKTVNGNALLGAGDITITGAAGSNAPQVQIQYSIDGATSWHSTPVAADFYARFSVDNGATWGSAIKYQGQGTNAPAVQSQYSADGSTWHGTLVPATDAYVRFSSDGGSTWSNAILFVSTNEKTLFIKDGLKYTCSDEISDIIASTSVPKVTDRLMYGFTVDSIVGTLTTAATGSTFTVDIKKNGVSVFSTKITFTAGSTTTVGGTAYILTSTPLVFSAEDIVTIFVTATGTVSSGKGLKIALIGHKN